jgi:hypothetical protein
LSHFAEHGEGRYKVWADVIETGEDLIVFIGGGEMPHIGSISISEKGGEPFSISVPEHKDYVVSSEAARKISEATSRVCLVVVGIHVKNASKLDIQKLLRNSNKCIDVLLDKICRLPKF